MILGQKRSKDNNVTELEMDWSGLRSPECPSVTRLVRTWPFVGTCTCK